MQLRHAIGLALLLGSSMIACAKPRVADPREAANEYAQALSRSDGDAIYEMLSRRSQRDLGRADTRRLVSESKRELAAQAEELKHKSALIKARAVIRFEDGEQAELDLEEGVFKVGSVGAVPAAARTPAEALGDLRRALSRRSYPAILRLLSSETGGQLESDLSALVSGLEDPQTLDIQVQGEAAQVELPGGHRIELKREAGIWRVEDMR